MVTDLGVDLPDPTPGAQERPDMEVRAREGRKSLRLLPPAGRPDRGKKAKRKQAKKSRRRNR